MLLEKTGWRRIDYEEKQQSIICIFLKDLHYLAMRILFLLLISFSSFAQVDSVYTVHGKVIDVIIDQPIKFPKIIIAGTDGSAQEVEGDSLGQFKVRINKKNTYQLQADSDILEHPCNEFGKRYYASGKFLLSKDSVYQDVIIEMTHVVSCGYRLLLVAGDSLSIHQISGVDSLKLNELYSILSDNPTLTITIKKYNASNRLIANVYHHLMSLVVDKRRLSVDSTSNEPFEIDCYMEWNNKYRFNDIHAGDQVTQAYWDQLSDPSQQFLQKYLSMVYFTVVSTDYRP